MPFHISLSFYSFPGYNLALSSFSATNRLTKVPINGKICTDISSPFWTYLPWPIATPAGVPVIMAVPGSNVVPRLRKLMSLGTLKIKSLKKRISVSSREDSNTYSAPEFCTSSPFRYVLRCSFEGSGIMAELTSTGPMGHVPSNPFEKHHWLCSSCVFRWLTSFDAVYPRT